MNALTSTDRAVEDWNRRQGRRVLVRPQAERDLLAELVLLAKALTVHLKSNKKVIHQLKITALI